MTKKDKEISISNEWHQQTSFSCLLITECGDGMCTGTHNVTEVISLHRSASLLKWEYTLIKSMCCGGRSPPSAIANNLTTKVNNNTKHSHCPQKDVLSTEMEVPKDTHAPALMPLSCFPFNSVIGSDKHSKICYTLLTKEWKMKSKNTKSEIVGESL